MSKLKLISICVALGLVGSAGCSSSSGGDDDGGGGGDGAIDDLPPFTNGVSTLTGHADPGDVDGPRGAARFANPVNVAYGPDGKLYVADFDNGKIRAVDVDDGTTTTVIAQAGFRRPFGMAFTADGRLFVSTDADPQGNQNPMSGTIWRINITARMASVVAANVGRARGLAALADGRLAFTDNQSHVLQILDPSTGTVSPLAGSRGQAGMVDAVGAAARFNAPYALVQRGDGSLIVAELDNHRLRVVDLDGSVSTLAGAGAPGYTDGAMSAARFNNPQGLAMASNGDVYITDLGNYRVRRLRGDTIETVAGNGTGGYADSDNRLSAELYGLEGVSLKPDGSMLFIADGGRGEDVPFNRIRTVKM